MSQEAGSTSSNVPVQLECGILGKKRWAMGTTTFEIDENYHPMKEIGRGAFGVVCEAKDMETGEKVAIKKIGNAFDDLVDSRRMLRELKILRLLKHENIIAVKDLLKPAYKENKEDSNDVYIVYELMDSGLNEVIRSKSLLTNEHVQYFTYQILRGLKYVHTANILHRDLKPNNLLVNVNCDLKISSFGLARIGSETDNRPEELVRWYGAPEVLVSCENYTAAVDMWAVGCILGEMLGRKPLMAGRDYIHQMATIIKTLGTPSQEDMSFIRNPEAVAYIRSLPRAKKVDFKSLLPDAAPLAIDLMERLLQFNPVKRIDVHQALKHPWLTELHNEVEEPGAPGEIALQYEDSALTEQDVRRLLYEETGAYYRS